jgi:hypothetical protein
VISLSFGRACSPESFEPIFLAAHTMKAIKKKVWLLLWPAIAAFRLLFSSQLAPAKSAFVPENRVCKIFPLAAESHQLNPSQVSQAQRERAPPIQFASRKLGTALAAIMGLSIFMIRVDADNPVVQRALMKIGDVDPDEFHFWNVPSDKALETSRA